MANTAVNNMQRSNKTNDDGPTWIGRTQTGLINLLSGLLERNQCCAAAECDESIMHRDDQTADALHVHMRQNCLRSSALQPL